MISTHRSSDSPSRRVPLVLAVLCLAATSDRATWAQIEHLQGLGEVTHHAIESDTLGLTYHVLVSAPRDIAPGTKLPTVYLLDGGVTFPVLAAYHGYLGHAQEAPQALVVGVSYGNDDWGTGNQRGRDFTAPAADREHYGGAANFAAFLEGHVLPLVEREYPSDPARRIVFGQSLGGQFVLFAAQTKLDLFWGHIASNPALHRNLDFFLEASPEASTGTTRRVFVSSGSDDNPRFRQPALRWIEHWTGRDAPWQLETVTLDGENHFSALPTAYRQGMRWLFRTR